MRTAASIPSSGSTGVAAKILLSLFCGAALLIGTTVTYMFARGIVPGLRTHLWRETPCRIVESRVAQGADGSVAVGIAGIIFMLRARRGTAVGA